MGLLKSIAGVCRFFWRDLVEDWEVMDRKLLRIAAGAIGFAIAALFWYYFFSGFSLF